MDTTLIVALVIPILIAFGARYFLQHTFTWKEFAAQTVAISLIVSLVYMVGRYSDAWDTELWNGQVTAKEIDRRTCQWGWRDFPDSFCTNYYTRQVRDGETCTTHTDSKGNSRRSCTPRYKTQYKSVYPWEQKFYVFSNVKETYQIARVDAQGARTPPRYTVAYVGEPVSAAKSYTNWIRAASSNLFYEDGAAEDKYRDILPQYPDKVYDYYRVDRVLGVGVQFPQGWNVQLSEKLKTLGPKKQMNAIVVLADANKIAPDFAFALRRFWMGFKKNDAVIVVGLDQGNVKWAEVMSWSKKSIFDISMRDYLYSKQDTAFDFTEMLGKLDTFATEYYERREMKEFEYLKSQIPTPTWLTIMLVVLSVGGSIGLTWFFHKEDPFGGNMKLRRSFR